MFSSIRSRLWLSFAGLIVVALLIVAAGLTVFLLRNPYTYRQTAVRLVAAENLLLRDPRTAGRTDVVADALDVRVLVFSARGDLISDTGPGQTALRPVTLDEGKGGIETMRDARGRVWLFSRARLTDGSMLLVAAPRPRLLPRLELLKDDLWRPMIQAGLIGLLLALVLAYVLAGWIAGPLQQLIRASREVGNAGSQASAAREEKPAGRAKRGASRVEERGPQEVRELTRAFNAMLDRVEATQRSQKEFVANVSHELKTPLTSIQGFSQAMLDGTAESPEARHQAAEIIHAEAARMHRMAEDLLELARLDAGTVELEHSPVDVCSLLSGLEERFRPIAAASGITLRLSCAEGMPPVNGDRDRLAQVFNNLIDNAVKFTPRGGTVEVAADQDQHDVRVTVKDSGIGISAEDVAHIFDRFYQADASRSGRKHGSGLGLAIAREMTEAHGGRITVRSTLGQGAVFTVHLPPLDGSRVGRGAA